jgi:hypothetical protein
MTQRSLIGKFQHRKEISMPPEGYEPAILAVNRPRRNEYSSVSVHHLTIYIKAT